MSAYTKKETHEIPIPTEKVSITWANAVWNINETGHEIPIPSILMQIPEYSIGALLNKILIGGVLKDIIQMKVCFSEVLYDAPDGKILIDGSLRTMRSFQG